MCWCDAQERYYKDRRFLWPGYRVMLAVGMIQFTCIVRRGMNLGLASAVLYTGSGSEIT